MATPAPIAIVTGGSRGLGRSTVLSLARRGVHSIFTYHSNRAEAEKVASLAREAGVKAIALQLDTGNVSAFDDFVAAVRKALQSWGRERFDYLVNNAGNSQHINFEKMTEADFDAVVNVHFKGVYFLTQKLLPLMNDGGRIANLSSGLTRVAVPGSSAYAAAKGAVEIHPLSRQRARAASDHRQRGGARPHPDGLQRRHGARQSRSQQNGLGDDRPGASGTAG
jgi:NAD(P)-dependent dehydrogenase (short-subunit alcohol dehydrogenase family)